MESGRIGQEADRAATASQPSPEEVSGIAGIPCAVFSRLADQLDREGHAFATVANFVLESDRSSCLFHAREGSGSV